MNEQELRRQAHDAEVTVWVGKAGLDAVVDELSDQLTERNVVKVKFLRAARGGTTTEALATDLANRVNASVVYTRGHTGVFHR